MRRDDARPAARCPGRRNENPWSVETMKTKNDLCQLMIDAAAALEDLTDGMEEGGDEDRRLACALRDAASEDAAGKLLHALAWLLRVSEGGDYDHKDAILAHNNAAKVVDQFSEEEEEGD